MSLEARLPLVPLKSEKGYCLTIGHGHNYTEFAFPTLDGMKGFLLGLFQGSDGKHTYQHLDRIPHVYGSYATKDIFTEDEFKILVKGFEPDPNHFFP